VEEGITKRGAERGHDVAAQGAAQRPGLSACRRPVRHCFALPRVPPRYSGGLAVVQCSVDRGRLLCSVSQERTSGLVVPMLYSFLGYH
jgi:hypothetical protein